MEKGKTGRLSETNDRRSVCVHVDDIVGHQIRQSGCMHSRLRPAAWSSFAASSDVRVEASVTRIAIKQRWGGRGRDRCQYWLFDQTLRGTVTREGSRLEGVPALLRGHPTRQTGPGQTVDDKEGARKTDLWIETGSVQGRGLPQTGTRRGRPGRAKGASEDGSREGGGVSSSSTGLRSHLHSLVRLAR